MLTGDKYLRFISFISMPNPDGTPTPHEKARHEHNHPDKHYGSYCINPHSTSLPTTHSNPFLVSLHISAEINSHYAGDSESDDEAKKRFEEQFDEATKTIVDRLKPDRVVDAHSKDEMIKAVQEILPEWGDGDWQLTPKSRPHARRTSGSMSCSWPVLNTRQTNIFTRLLEI